MIQLLRNNKFKKVLYIIISLIIFFCIISTLNIKVNHPDIDNVIKTVTAEEFSEFDLANCHTEIDDNGNNIFVPDNADPNVFILVPDTSINCVKVTFVPELSKVESAQLYYAILGENLSEDKSISSILNEETYSVVLPVPEGNYNVLRLDVAGQYAVESMEYGFISESFNPIRYSFNWSSICILIFLIVLTAILEKSLGYYSFLKYKVKTEKEFLLSIKKQHKKWRYFLRWAVDIWRIVYIAIFVILLSRCVVDENSILFFFVISIILLAISIFDKIINEKDCKPAKIFLIVSLLVCAMMSYCFPINTHLSWDDEIHYYNSTQLRAMIYGNEYTTADEDLRCRWNVYSDYISSPYDACLRLLTEDQIISYHNRPYVNVYNYIGYFPAATTMFICDLFNVGFVSMIILSKLSNSFVFAFIVYLGMKKLKSGQYILASIALMPTCLFLASVFSYDYWVNAFTMYSIAYLISELQQPEKKLELKDAFLMLGSMFLGCGPKAIYFILLIPFLFVQKEKFSDKFTKKKYIISTILTASLIAFSFVLLMLIGGVGSDLRGGSDVNGSEQIKYILRNPVEYDNTLINFIKNYISIENLEDWFNNYAYLSFGNNIAECSTISIIIMAMCAFWDKGICDKFNHCLAFKLTTFVALFIQTALVSTALYISFTPVGNQWINGVQGRYMFPLLFPFLYCIGSVYTRTKINSKFMKGFVFGGLSLNVIWLTYLVYIKQFLV